MENEFKSGGCGGWGSGGAEEQRRTICRGKAFPQKYFGLKNNLSPGMLRPYQSTVKK